MTEATGVPVVVVPSSPAPPTPIKSGWGTSEFYMAWFAKIMGALVTSGILGDGTQASRIAGLIVIILAQAGYTYSRTMIKTAAMMFALLIMSNGVIACGPNARQQTIRATLVAGTAMEQAFVTFDEKIQEALIQSATDRANAEAVISAWRKKRITGQEYITELFKAIAIAATFSDDVTLQSMLSSLAITRQQLTAMGVTL